MIALCHEDDRDQLNTSPSLQTAVLAAPTTEELRSRALEGLAGAFPGTAWAVAERSGDDTVHVHVLRDLGEDDARDLARRFLDPASSVVVHGATPMAQAWPEPARAATWPPDGSAPTLALGVWTAPGAAGPTDSELQLGLQLVATVASTARALNALRVKTTFDEQTGVMNRAAILDLAERERTRAQRYGRALSVVFVDIDSLKHVNDTYGHTAGDALIAAVARALRAVLRTSDAVGRLGGDEFLAVLPETDARGARTAVEHLRQALARSPIRVGRHVLTPSASFGLATLGEVGAGDLIGTADQRMLLSKRRRKKDRGRYESHERRRRPVAPRVPPAA